MTDTKLTIDEGRPLDGRVRPLAERLRCYIRQLSPHHLERDGGKLLIAAEKEISSLAAALQIANVEADRMRAVVTAAVRSVTQPAWAGVCDEDIALEDALKDGGWLERPNMGVEPHSAAGKVL